MNLKRTTAKGLLRPCNLLISLALCILGAIPLSAWAEPYLAIQEGYKCSKCHVNMTGGGKRTDFGNVYVQTRLANSFLDWKRPGQKLEDEKENPAKTDSQSSFFSGRLNEYFAFGGDFRMLLEETTTPGGPSTQAFNQSKQNIYLSVDLIPDRVIFYQTLVGGDAKEIFGLLKGELWGEPYHFKAGQFFLPYGLRLQDDSAFTRAVTGFTYHTADVGAEFGFEPGPWAIHVAMTNGTGSSTETNRNKQLTTSVAYVHRYFRLGASYATNKDAQGVETVISGAHAGAQFGRVGILAEADVIDDSKVKQTVSILETNILMSRGNNLKLSYEYYDPSDAIFQNARTRYSAVWEPFLNQFTQLRTGIRASRGIPQNPGFNSNLYFAELHLFF
jgi:hypothetical protein